MDSDRIPPQNLEMEQAVLGSMLIAQDVIPDVMDHVGREDFYRSEHQTIFWAMTEMHARGRTIDVITVQEVLRKLGKLEECGGSSYLIHLMDSVPSADNAPFYAAVVAEKAGLRRLIDASTQIRALANSEYDEITDIYDRAYSIVSDAVQHHDCRRASDSRSVIEEVLTEIETRRREGTPRGIPTGFTDIDRWTSGFGPGELIIVAGAPSMGKSSFAMQCAEGMARSGQVLVISLEMTRAEIMHRQISVRTGINLHRLRSGMVSEEEMRSIRDSSAEIAALPISYHDRGVDTAGLIRHAVRRARPSPVAVVIDYLQIMRIEKSTANRAQDIGTVTRDLKGMARDYSCPVVLLSQLSRMVAGRKQNEPILSDLRDSGAIEADADMVLFVHRPQSGHYGGKEVIGEGSDIEDAAIIVAKQRNGPTGIIPMTFRRSCAAWGSSLGKKREEQYAAYMHAPKSDYGDDPFA
jgi:replicative DNA helicase